MSEIISSNVKGSKGKRKTLSTRVDLTPMVDLGFLLIIFFIITTSLTQNHAMKVNLPVEGTPVKTPESKTITLILKDHNAVDYYNGNDLQNIASISFKDNGVRKVLMNKKKMVKTSWGTDTGTTVIIKPSRLSTYNNVVAALNEMSVNSIRKFVLTDLNAEEIKVYPSYH